MSGRELDSGGGAWLSRCRDSGGVGSTRDLGIRGNFLSKLVLTRFVMCCSCWDAFGDGLGCVVVVRSGVWYR